MTFNLAFFIFSLFVVGVAEAQQAPPAPAPNTSETSQPVPPAPKVQNQGVDELLDGSGLVINKNVFSYDANEGRDPFKVSPEFVAPVITPGPGDGIPGNGNLYLNNVKSIRTVLVPEDIVVQGIIYRKKDPVALVIIKGVKGLNKLKVNSPVGRNEGKVIDIQPGKIVIEQVKDFDGQKITEKVVLEVRAKKN